MESFLHFTTVRKALILFSLERHNYTISTKYSYNGHGSMV